MLNFKYLSHPTGKRYISKEIYYTGECAYYVVKRDGNDGNLAVQTGREKQRKQRSVRREGRTQRRASSAKQSEVQLTV